MNFNACSILLQYQLLFPALSALVDQIVQNKVCHSDCKKLEALLLTRMFISVRVYNICGR